MAGASFPLNIFNVATFYRIFLGLLVAGITWFSILKHVEQRDRTIRVEDLRQCFQRREFAPTQPPQRVRENFFRAIARLHEAQIAERSLGWWRNQEVNTDWYVHEALNEAGGSRDEAHLIGTALQNAYHEVRRQGTLALTEGRARLSSGREPISTEGLFAGDPLVIGHRISPVIVPELRNHPANFVLQPSTAWALQQDVLDSSIVGLARQFQNAGLLPAEVVERLREQLNRQQDVPPAEKND